MHSDRYRILSKIKNLSNKSFKTFFFFYLHSKWYFYLIKTFTSSFNNSSINEFSFVSTSKQKISTVIKESKATIDIEHPNQHGLTMRTFEVLGAKRKLITTNIEIKDYDFYNTANFLIIYRINPLIPDSFLQAPFQDLPDPIYNKYKLSSWIEEIFSK